MRLIIYVETETDDPWTLLAQLARLVYENIDEGKVYGDIEE